MRRVLVMLMLGAVVACKGPEGPMGPPGPQGLPGPPGPGSRVTLTAIANASGQAIADVPASVPVNASQPPSMSCYYTDNPASGTWVSVSSTASTTWPYCGLVIATATNRWRAVMLQLTPGYTAAFVIVH